jgi:hypothetical protein
VYALTDVIWTTYHANPTDTQDLQQLEKEVIADSYSALEMYTGGTHDLGNSGNSSNNGGERGRGIERVQGKREPAERREQQFSVASVDKQRHTEPSAGGREPYQYNPYGLQNGIVERTESPSQESCDAGGYQSESISSASAGTSYSECSSGGVDW